VSLCGSTAHHKRKKGKW